MITQTGCNFFAPWMKEKWSKYCVHICIYYGAEQAENCMQLWEFCVEKRPQRQWSAAQVMTVNWCRFCLLAGKYYLLAYLSMIISIIWVDLLLVVNLFKEKKRGSKADVFRCIFKVKLAITAYLYEWAVVNNGQDYVCTHSLKKIYIVHTQAHTRFLLLHYYTT